MNQKLEKKFTKIYLTKYWYLGFINNSYNKIFCILKTQFGNGENI